MACPMRFVLVFLSAVVAAVLAWRSWKKADGPDDALCAPEERKPAGEQRGGRAGAEDRGAAPGGDRAAPERTGGPPLRARDAGRAHGGACEPSARTSIGKVTPDFLAKLRRWIKSSAP